MIKAIPISSWRGSINLMGILSMLGFWPDRFSAEIRFTFAPKMTIIAECYRLPMTDDLLMATSVCWLTDVYRRIQGEVRRDYLIRQITLFCDGKLSCVQKQKHGSLVYFLNEPWSELVTTFSDREAQQVAPALLENGPFSFLPEPLERGTVFANCPDDRIPIYFDKFSFRVRFISGAPLMYPSWVKLGELLLPFAGVVFTAHTAVRLSTDGSFDSPAVMRQRAVLRDWLTLLRTSALASTFQAGNRLKSLFEIHGLTLPTDS